MSFVCGLVDWNSNGGAMSKQKCFKCKGRGWTTSVDWVFAILTLGITFLVDKSDRQLCDACGGSGWIAA